ncbi:4-alpha-glucanotransferase [Tychonema sp. LEGE 07203]|uniref:4-alpha-glucanotransferase n=1 Tax=Tychonema sp. LEGE 07203 TaxID=1828671 RepID=UPI001881AD10|nr:4-alpha-glucanotransferase [Tychonema sp. LEGE 07203]MBE9097217.1 4-alpha-glucanotransferase [Tychonema sp. LEGE 07203]
MLFPRSSGILLHPTSFPSRFGVGDMGIEAYKFIDFLVESDQQYWQILPLGPTGYGNSPYSCYSAMAGNPLLLSPEIMRDEQLLSDEDLDCSPEFGLDTVEFDRAIAHKIHLLKKACENFKAKASPVQQKEFSGFCESKALWLEDYALFMALKDRFNGTSWHTWEPEIAQRKPEALDKWRQDLNTEIYYYKYVQFEFFRQWSELKRYANLRDIKIIGDIPIYVAHDSADVWSNPELFCLDEASGEPALMAGVPPDYFSATGQLWGNPVYNWEALQANNFEWWVQRFEALFEYVDVSRIDHFRGFDAYWAVKRGQTNAMEGEWIKAPGTALFEVINQKFGNLPIIAEDLGLITPEVEALRDRFEFPGMKILQFAFGAGPEDPFWPFNFAPNCVVYTGTHDNDTTVGWFNQLQQYERDEVLRYLGCIDPQGIHWSLIRMGWTSVANLAVVPFQDLLGLATDARMNFPGKAEGNWGWRYRREALNWEVRDRLKTMTYISRRTPNKN